MILLNEECLNKVWAAQNESSGTSYSAMHCIHIEDNDGMRSYVAMNAKTLLIVKEKPEGDALQKPLNVNLAKKIKVHGKTQASLTEIGTTGILLDDGKNKTLLQKKEDYITYPDYQKVIPTGRDFLKDLVLFHPAELKIVYDFLGGFDCLPFMESTTSTALWIKKEGDAELTAVLVPLKIR